MGKAVAFITGASRGIGRGIAMTLAEAGYDIVAAATKADPDNQESGVYAVKDAVEALGQRCLPVAGDISNVADHQPMIDAALAEFGRIDILVNNAGVSVLDRNDLLEASEESYDRVMGINLRGPHFLTQAIARQMVKQVEAGVDYAPRIIFITSVSSDTASPNRTEYCISKAGLSMSAQNYAVHLAQYGINVYDLRPGIIHSDMTTGVTDKYDKLIEDGLLLQKRWGTPEDVGKACVGLCEGYFDYATGAIIELGGGMGVKRL